MLNRITHLLHSGKSFAFETTLSTKSYLQLVNQAKAMNYQVTCLFFWLETEELAISRVEHRVKEGGHFIPEKIIRRRYKRGLRHFFNLFLPIFDNWLFINNSGDEYEVIAEGTSGEEEVGNHKLWNTLKQQHHGD